MIFGFGLFQPSLICVIYNKTYFRKHSSNAKDVMYVPLGCLRCDSTWECKVWVWYNVNNIRYSVDHPEIKNICLYKYCIWVTWLKVPHKFRERFLWTHPCVWTSCYEHIDTNQSNSRQAFKTSVLYSLLQYGISAS